MGKTELLLFIFIIFLILDGVGSFFTSIPLRIHRRVQRGQLYRVSTKVCIERVFGGKTSESALSQPIETSSHQVKVLDSVIRIFCTHTEPDFSMPWQRTRSESTTSSGFVISTKSGKLQILTNAHAVEYGSVIQVKKRSSERKTVAKLVAVGHECDLAVLEVDEEDFWDGLMPLEFGDLPSLQVCR